MGELGSLTRSLKLLRRAAGDVGAAQGLVGAVEIDDEPEAKRARSRSESRPSSRGGWSLVSTSWAPLRSSALRCGRTPPGAVLAREELHVVDEEDVDAAELVLEVANAGAAQRAGEVVDEALARAEVHAQVRGGDGDVVGDRVEEVASCRCREDRTAAAD